MVWLGWVALAGLVVSTSVMAQAPPDTEATWLRKPTADELRAVWPVGALANGEAGKGIVRCVATVTGALANCKVVSESPPGQGFGAAALALTPNFLMKPATHGGHPVAGSVTIPVVFKTSGGGGGRREGVTEFRLAAWLPWTAAPTYRDVIAAEPPAANGRAGFVSMRCGLSYDGGLKDCDPITEEPRGAGFARAALALSRRFKTSLKQQASPLAPPVLVSMAFQFPAVGADPLSVRYIDEPDWTAVINEAAAPKLYPDKAASAGVHTGSATVDCLIGPDGALTSCISLQEQPPGLDLGEAALKVARAMRVNLWNRDGQPTPGAHMRFPVRLIQAPDPGPATLAAPTP